jgi:hypothetical protein
LEGVFKLKKNPHINWKVIGSSIDAGMIETDMFVKLRIEHVALPAAEIDINAAVVVVDIAAAANDTPGAAIAIEFREERVESKPESNVPAEGVFILKKNPDLKYQVDVGTEVGRLVARTFGGLDARGHLWSQSYLCDFEFALTPMV